MGLHMTKYKFLGATALSTATGVAVALSPVSARAQDDPAEQPEAAAAEAEAEEGAIVVVGSRLGRVTAFNSPDPVAIIDPEVAMQEGKFDTAAMLQSSPIAAGSTQITSAISSNFVTNGGPGAATVDLRGLGANRTLVLLNGRRAGPAGTRGAVSSFDLNVLPVSLAQSVEILKTGASSVYGSDAVAGVVNIKTKSNIDGIQLGGNVSMPFDSGGEQYRLNAIWGKTFDRGHILIAGDYSHTSELARGQREYLACPEAYIFREDGSRADLVDPRTGAFHCEDLRWGHVWTYNLIDNLQLDGPGGPNTGLNTSIDFSTVLMQYQYPGETLGIPAFGAPEPGFGGAPFGSADFGAPPGWFPVGYNAASTAVQSGYHPFVEQQSIIPETDLYTGYIEGAYEINDNVEAFGEFLFNRRETYQNGWRQFWSFGLTGDLYGYNPGGNDYNYWAGGWSGLNLLSPTAITDQSDTSQDVKYFRGVAGLRGNFGGESSWRWEAFTQYSRSDGRYRTQQVLQDAYDSNYFQYGSCAGTVLPFSGKQCMDIPWTDPNFLRGEITPEQSAFLFDWEEGKTIYTQRTFEASVSGDLFELPAGPLSAAFGASLRRDSINDVPGAITFAKNPYYNPAFATLAPTDLRCTQEDLDRIDRRDPCNEFHGNAWGASTSGITAGHSTTSELFGELRVPLLADRPFFQELTLSAGGRLTNVTSTRLSDGETDDDEGNYTYKLGLNWAVNDWVRFRGSYGTSFRAPALFEQFLADETSFPTQRAIDPCRQWGAENAAGRISDRIAANCAAAGIPSTHPATGVTATSIASGGLGVLDSETSRSWVVGGILTPQLGNFLPDTRISIAVDYFDIKVVGEIAQLGARAILFGCYGSETFPTDPLCSLFTRGQTAAPFNINTVNDQYININRQQNTGVDVTVNIRHDLGRWGSVNVGGDMTWQTKDELELLASSELESDNGEAGSPKFIGDFRLNWQTPIEELTVFYGLNVIGKTSNVADFLEDNGGDLCLDSFNTETTPPTPIYGTYCPDLTTPMVFYHNASVSYDFMERFTITAGVSNIFDRRPPRVSVFNGAQITMLGPVVAASQYPFIGRRAFVNLTAEF